MATARKRDMWGIVIGRATLVCTSVRFSRQNCMVDYCNSHGWPSMRKISPGAFAVLFPNHRPVKLRVVYKS